MVILFASAGLLPTSHFAAFSTADAHTRCTAITRKVVVIFLGWRSGRRKLLGKSTPERILLLFLLLSSPENIFLSEYRHFLQGRIINVLNILW